MIQTTPLSKSPKVIGNMFSSVSGKYDFLNRLLSLGQDIHWRKTTANTAFEILNAKHHDNIAILDIGSGTGDLSFEFFKTACSYNLIPNVFSIDISNEMLQLSVKKKYCLKMQKVHEINASALNLPLKEKSFDIITAGFAVRNIPSAKNLFKILYRLLKPNGIIAILEFVPIADVKMNPLNRFYLENILPVVGNIISNTSYNAYTYLFKSILNYYDTKEFTLLLKEAGFNSVTVKTLAFDVVSLTTARKGKCQRQ